MSSIFLILIFACPISNGVTSLLLICKIVLESVKYQMVFNIINIIHQIYIIILEIILISTLS